MDKNDIIKDFDYNEGDRIRPDYDYHIYIV